MTTIGACAVASEVVLTTVFEAMTDVGFFAAGGRAGVVDSVMSGPCSMGPAVAGCNGAVGVAISCAGAAEVGIAGGAGG